MPPPYKIKGFGRFKLKSLFKKKAFTLAETLITLTIIGVVAALTIPSLVSEYQKHTYVVGLKKAYANLQNAMKMIPITEGCPAGDYHCAGLEHFNSEKTIEALSKQFKTKMVDLTGEDEACKSMVNNDNWSCLVTDDGMIISSYGDGENDFGVDVNGLKGPNKWGRDRFAFHIVSQWDYDYYSSLPIGTLLPAGSKQYAGYGWVKPCKPQTADSSFGVSKYCTARVLEEDAMNY